MSTFRVALAGASGSLGQEIVQVLEERRFPMSELRPFATERSLGQEVEIFGDLVPIDAEPPPLRGLDLLILATPAAAALDLVREALRAEIPCIDCSGAMAGSAEVPLYIADLTAPQLVRQAPLIAIPTSQALSWAHPLAALEGSVGVKRVVGTIAFSASRGGRQGIEVLSQETISLLGQQSIPESDVFASQVAFDCVPDMPEATEADGEESGAAPAERSVAADLRRLISPDLPIGVTSLQIPTFAGEGSSLAVETTNEMDPARACELFDKAPGLELFAEDERGPTTRDASGRDVTLVGRVRRDPSVDSGLLFWLVGDGLRLAAQNAVKLAEIRLAAE
jgi:aspartate-semialdehyde dehydrogenase